MDRGKLLIFFCVHPTFSLFFFFLLKAPLNLHALRAIAKIPREPIDPTPPYAPNQADYINPWLKSPTSVSECSAPLLSSVDDQLLVRLAAAGFNPSSLAMLAGQGRWIGFAGLLASAMVSRCPKTLSNLYRHFRRVHRYILLAVATYIYQLDF